MLTHLSLRLRIFLFFCLLALGGVALAGGAMVFGWSRSAAEVPADPFVTAFIVFAFVNSGLVLGIWLLFDEYVSKPIGQLSAVLRLGAHSGIEVSGRIDNAQYLGDLAPAAEALSRTAASSVTDTATRVARETERLRIEAERLTAVLSESPVATILLNAALEIVLYDAQAAGVMSKIAQPRLRAPIGDYFDQEALADVLHGLSPQGPEANFTLRDASGSHTFDARLKALSDDGYMIFIDAEATPADTLSARPLVFDFDLMNAAETHDINDTRLSQLCYVPFDTETTGLSVEKDDIVQIGAVRVLNGRIVEGEVVDAYVNPGRPIPPASTEIHHVTDADVAQAPGIAEAARAFHHFARDAVLVAHNAPFDIGLLRKYEAKTGCAWTHPVLDTVLLSAVVFGTTEEHSLDALCARLGVTIPPELRHTALGDARATAEALTKLLPLIEGRGITTFGALIAETRKHSRLLEDLNT